MIPVQRWTARECRARLSSGEVSVREVAAAWRTRIAEHDPAIRAYVHVAEHEPGDPVYVGVDDGRAPGPAGLPLAVKDNVAVAGMPLTCGSRILEGYVPGHDAEVVRRYREGGGWVLGKTNLDEFAMGGSCEHSVHGATRNPWDPERVPGGSSGGSAAAVAAGLAPWALGSDTGGSIRQPAAFCGVWGLKPTYGRYSRRGLVAYGSSLDQIGPFARDLRDLAWLYRWLVRHDPLDETCRDRPAGDPVAACDAGVRGLRFAVPATFRELADASCREVLDRAAEALQSEGAERVEADVPFVRHTLPVYYVLACAEASSNLARYDGIRYGRRAPDAEDLRGTYERTRREGFGAEVRRRVLLGAFALSAGYRDAYYDRAVRARARLREEFEGAFAACDVLMTPTVPFPAFRLGERLDDPWSMYAADVCTASINLAGVPALHVPRGLGDDRLPRGVQAIAPAFSEETLFRIAGALEVRGGPELPLDHGAAR